MESVLGKGKPTVIVEVIKKKEEEEEEEKRIFKGKMSKL